MKLKFATMLAFTALLLTAGTCADPNGNTGVVPPKATTQSELILPESAIEAEIAKNRGGVAPNENPAINLDPALKAQNDECVKKGGSFGMGPGRYVCTLPNPDAGKTCKSSKDCSGHCLAETMTCSPTTPYFGCFEEALGNGQKATLCVD